MSNLKDYSVEAIKQVLERAFAFDCVVYTDDANRAKYADQNLKDQRRVRAHYLLSEYFDIHTYDDCQSETICDTILQVATAISEGKTFAYLEQNDAQYRDYILVCHLPFFESRLNWDTSIRGAWWDMCGDGEGHNSPNNVIDVSTIEDNVRMTFADSAAWINFIEAMVQFLGPAVIEKTYVND